MEAVKTSPESRYFALTNSLTPNDRIAELEELLQKQTAELLEAKKEVEDFNYSISHDLRAPLRHISGYAQIMMEDFGPQLDPKCREYLQNIQEGAQRMTVLIESLLCLSRIRRQKLSWQPLDIDILVRGIIRDLESKNSERKIEWRVASLPCIDGDSALLKQALSNLLANAVKFTRTKSAPMVEVGILHKDNQTVFFISDNGTGFDTKYADRLFSMFQRLHPQNEFEGIGAGLAITKQIIQKHGGRIWAEAVAGHGATFFFTLGAARVLNNSQAANQ